MSLRHIDIDRIICSGRRFSGRHHFLAMLHWHWGRFIRGLLQAFSAVTGAPPSIQCHAMSRTATMTIPYHWLLILALGWLSIDITWATRFIMLEASAGVYTHWWAAAVFYDANYYQSRWHLIQELTFRQTPPRNVPATSCHGVYYDTHI